MTQDDRTMPAEQAQKYMNELHARNVPYSFLPLSHGLVTVSTRGAFAVASYDAFLASEKLIVLSEIKTREST
jgi:hypothetical protein